MEFVFVMGFVALMYPVGVGFGLWLLISWYRARGKEEPAAEPESFRRLNLESLWFPQTKLEAALETKKERPPAAP